MRHEPDAGSMATPGPLDDLLTGSGCLTFVEGDTQVHVGWLRVGGDGLVVTARVDEGVIGQTRFWCDAQQWCDWLAPSLPVPSWDALPPAWHASAASLTLATGERRGGTSNDTVPGEWLDSADTTAWPSATSLSRDDVETAWRVGLVLQREGRQLALTYLDGATSWLRERCQRATRCDAPLDPTGWPERRCALVAGWVMLPAAQCEELHAGDAVLLDVAADIEHGEYWLVDGDYAIAMRDGQPSDRPVVRFESTDVARWYAVVAERRFPIPLLMAWRSGVPVAPHPSTTACALHAGRITLCCDRLPRSGGRLLRFDDGRLAVHIEGKASAQIAYDTPDGDDPSGDISGRDLMGVHPPAT
ncbi:MAG: hypothetical protein P4M06_09850 [Pandoraea sp.]|nr:hypothetical protein [Pandoraea sp.]MDR3397853.1 hypothetical protein [Pandoraea sp.]